MEKKDKGNKVKKIIEGKKKKKGGKEGEKNTKNVTKGIKEKTKTWDVKIVTLHRGDISSKSFFLLVKKKSNHFSSKLFTLGYLYLCKISF